MRPLLAATTVWLAAFKGMGPIRVTFLRDGNARHAGDKTLVDFPEGITADDFRQMRCFSGDAIISALSFSVKHCNAKLRVDGDNASYRILDTYEFPLVGEWRSYRVWHGGVEDPEVIKYYVPRAFGIHFATTLGELADHRDKDGEVHPLALNMPSFESMAKAAAARRLTKATAADGRES